MKQTDVDDLIKGRGAQSNPSLRFYSQTTASFDDGWWQQEVDTSLKTTIIPEQARTIISTNQSADIPFDQSINPYRGCEHGCIYCYARPTHAYWDLSPGLDFETKIITKPNAGPLLEKALSHKNYVCKIINIGANTDPYQPLEAKQKTTRSILEVLEKYQHPFSLITKSALVLRDLDILAAMAKKNLCSVAVSVTTLDDDLKRKLEPRTASGKARLRVIKQLTGAGVPVSMMVAPVIPMLNDAEIETILEAGAEAGALTATMIFLRLPHEVSPLFREWLQVHYPQRADHVMSLVQQSRAGKDYESGYFTRMAGQGVFAETLRQRFNIAVKRFGLKDRHRFNLDTRQFKREFEQMALF